MNSILIQMDKKHDGVSCHEDGICISYSELKALDKIGLYLLENMNGPLLTMLSGLISSLSINLLTNFVEIDLGKGVWITLIALAKLLSCLVFNLALVYFTVVTLNASNHVIVSSSTLPKDKEKELCKNYLKYYEERRSRLRCSLILCAVFGILTIIFIIATPFASRILQNQMTAETDSA